MCLRIRQWIVWASVLLAPLSAFAIESSPSEEKTSEEVESSEDAPSSNGEADEEADASKSRPEKQDRTEGEETSEVDQKESPTGEANPNKDSASDSEEATDSKSPADSDSAGDYPVESDDGKDSSQAQSVDQDKSKSRSVEEDTSKSEGDVDASGASESPGVEPLADNPNASSIQQTESGGGDVDVDNSTGFAESASEETLIIMDDVESVDSGSQLVIIESPDSTLASDESPFEPSGRFRGQYQSRGLWDISHDGDAEDIFEWWQDLNLYLKYKFAETWDFISEIDTRYGVVGEAPQENAFWGFNVSYSKWLADVELRQGYLRWKDSEWEVSFGSRVFVWGKNELFAAADFLNPLSAQGDVIGLLSDPRLAKKPIWAVDASYQLGDHVFQLVVSPVFARSDVPIIGRDLALAPPGTELESQIRTAASIHPSIEDQIGDGFAGTEVPEESLWNSSIALRSSTNLGGWDFAATVGWIWDRNPTIYLDNDLRGLLASGVNLLGANAGGNLSPEATAQLAAVQQKAAIGQELFRATYVRQWVAALEGEGVLGPLVIRWDLGWKDGELAYTQNLESYRLMLLSGTFGLEYSYGESFFGQLSVFSQLGLDAPGEPLLGWDDGELDPGNDGRTATLVGGGLVMRGSPEDSDWDWSTRTVMMIFPFSVANVLEFGYLGFESQRLALGGLLIHGERGSLGDQFNRLNLAYLSYSIAF